MYYFSIRITDIPTMPGIGITTLNWKKLRVKAHGISVTVKGRWK